MTLFFVGGIALVLTPAIMVFCQDASLRQQMCEGAHNVATGLSIQGRKLFRTAESAVTNAASPSSKSGDGAGVSPAKITSLGAATATGSDVASSVSMVDQAVSVLTAQIAKDPANPALHNRLGLIYASVGDWQRAETQFNQAMDSSRDQLRDLNGQLASKKESGQIAQASQLMLDINQLELELSSAHSNLARVFEKMGQQSKVVAQLDQLNKDVVIGEGPHNVAVAAAAAPAVVAPAATGSTKKVSPQLVNLLAKANAWMVAGQPHQAMPLLKAALAIDPNLVEVHEQLGSINLSSGNFGRAVDEFSRASALAPNKASIHAALGVAYQYKGKLKEATTEFARAVALNPKDASSAFNLGNAYAAQNKNDEAIRCYQKAVAVDPSMAVAHNNLGSLFSLKHNYEQAAKEFEDAIALAPRMESAHYGLGVALYQTQNFGTASREFQAAQALNPGRADIQQKIAMCQQHSSQLSGRMYQNVAMR